MNFRVRLTKEIVKEILTGKNIYNNDLGKRNFVIMTSHWRGNKKLYGINEAVGSYFKWYTHVNVSKKVCRGFDKESNIITADNVEKYYEEGKPFAVRSLIVPNNKITVLHRANSPAARHIRYIPIELDDLLRIIDDSSLFMRYNFNITALNTYDKARELFPNSLIISVKVDINDPLEYVTCINVSLGNLLSIYRVNEKG